MSNHLQRGGFRHRVAFLTFTYRQGVDWSPSHIRRALSCYREWGRRRGVTIVYQWVMELQRNGTPHYHVMMWLPRGLTPPLPDKQGWWPHGMTNAKWVRSPVGYLAKYASKGSDTGTFPSGARLHGTGGLSPVLKAALSWHTAPLWLQKMVPKGHRVVKQSGGWWADMVHRIRYRTPWMVTGFTQGAVHLEWVGWTYDDIAFF